MHPANHFSILRGSATLHLLVAVALFCSACNSSSLKLYPVHGQVFYKNQPASGAQVVLQPKEEPNTDQKDLKPMAYGTVGDDGSFTLQTDMHGKGAVPGDYGVFITWYMSDPRDPQKSSNKLPSKYANQSKPEFMVTVKEEKNELQPFRLN
jgi:hypothetical protein